MGEFMEAAIAKVSRTAEQDLIRRATFQHNMRIAFWPRFAWLSVDKGGGTISFDLPAGSRQPSFPAPQACRRQNARCPWSLHNLFSPPWQNRPNKGK
jgi:hypothetical protein